MASPGQALRKKVMRCASRRYCPHDEACSTRNSCSVTRYRCAMDLAKMKDHELWMVFFEDPDENPLALMSEVPLK